MSHQDGDLCDAHHVYLTSNAPAPQCVWREGGWHREDGLKPCPF